MSRYANGTWDRIKDVFSPDTAKRKRLEAEIRAAHARTASRSWPKAMEICEYLARNENRRPFASNAFTRDSITSLMKRLYAAGAARIEATNIHAEAERLHEEGGPYADVLVVKVTRAKAPRVHAVIQSARPDVVRTKSTKDASAVTYEVWWD